MTGEKRLMSLVELYLNEPDIHCIEFNKFKNQILKNDNGKIENIIADKENRKVIARLVWDKKKYVFNYDIVILEKINGEEVCKVRWDSSHGIRHANSPHFKIPDPTYTLFKIEHPILKLVIDSLSKQEQIKWKEQLCEELEVTFEVDKEIKKDIGILKNSKKLKKLIDSTKQKAFNVELIK